MSSEDCESDSGKPNKMYKQYYRKAWEAVPEFKDWICSIPGDKTLAYCRICEKSLHAHRLSLIKHTVSLKHTRLYTRTRAHSQLQEAEDKLLEEVGGSGGGEVEAGQPAQPTTEQPLPPALQFKEERVVSTVVMDTSEGTPAAGLALTLYHLSEGRWTLLLEGQTSGDGRCGRLERYRPVRLGRFKLHFDTDRYFVLHRQPTFFPFIEIVFDISCAEERHHIPILLSPYGYSVCKGS